MTSARPRARRGSRRNRMFAQGSFIYLAAAITILAVIVITRKNPVHSVIFMVLLFFHVAALYITLNAEFLAAIQIIVYAGAILVLFLFVILLLNLKEEMFERIYVGRWPLGLAAAAGLLLMILVSLRTFTAGAKGTVTAEVVKAQTNTKVLGKVLLIDFLYPFEIVSMLLLVAIVGAIVLAKKKLRS